MCIDISVLRNQSGAGTVAKCSEFCAQIDLDEFFKALKNNYALYLDEQTDLLIDYCRNEDIQYGSARKVLNIFFRHICYNGFIQREFINEDDLYSNTSVLAPLELPIDSRTANSLSQEKWTSIKGLDRAVHQQYQDLAFTEAQRRGVARIHLDVEFWTPA
ncbi:hypothetical protein [Mucilaginibacter gossypii]|uniref:hypothetical protein n=1 Tax=Mucilaginibacter gossypii TaxID=551996 RepID=UPI00115FFB2D|nr:hypothetical protein [Mucilaginibacter gossypii]